MQQLERFQKLFISLRYYLLGASEHDESYAKTLKALEWAKHIHSGVRKDGFTPEFQHQLEIAHFIRTISPSLIYPADTITAGIIHDVAEDYSDKSPFITIEYINREFGHEIGKSVYLLSKKIQGVKKETALYFSEMEKDPIASIAKGVDRIHNQSSMSNVFSKVKQDDYVLETEEFILPMLKNARRNFPQQERAYENIKFVLKSQITFVKAGPQI